MTTKPKLDARGRLAAAEASVARWRKSIATAEADKLRAADKGDRGRVVSILDKLERLKDRLASAEARLVHVREDLPKAVKREQAVARAVRGGVKLADRVSSAAPVVSAKWAADREKERVAQVRQQRRPRNAEDGKVARGRKEVPDPWEPGARISVPCNTRESPIEHMWSRKRIDAYQKDAADRFRGLYERAQLGPIRGLDPAKEKVSGGQFSDPLSDALMASARELAAVNTMLGPVGAALMTNIAGEGITIESLAAFYPRLTAKRAQGYVTGRFLEDLVAHWGLRAEGRASPILGSGPITVTGPQAEHNFARPARAVDRLMNVSGGAKR